MQMVKNNTKGRIAARVPPAVEARIIELSMQHPEFGAKRLLPLLRKESIAISVSSIYNILRRHGLQNREKRFVKIQAQQTLEALRQKAADHPQQAEGPGIPPEVPRPRTRPREEYLRPAPHMAAGKAPFRKGWTAFEGAATKKARIPLGLKLVNVALFAALVFSGFHTALKVRRAREAPQTAATAIPDTIHIEEDAGEITVVTPPAENSTIRKRNLPDSDSRLESFADAQPAPIESLTPSYLSGGMWHGRSPWSFSLGFDELQSWLADARRLWQEATIDSYIKDDLPAGFTITELNPDGIYKKMGLQNGDVIQGVNGEAVTGPEQAVYFFQRVAEGGVVEIKIKRHRRTRYISLTIQ